MRISSHRFRLPYLLAVGIVLFVVQPALAARLLQVYIEQDGNVVVHTYYDDGGRADAATVWRYLENSPIMVDDDATDVEADSTNPLEALLEGDLVKGLQPPRFALRACQPAIGFFVADEFLFGRVPLQRSFQQVGDVA